MSEQEQIRRVGDVVPTGEALTGNQYHVRDLVGKEFTVTGVAEWEGEDGPYLAVGVEVEGEKGFFFSSHQAVFRKLLLCQDALPLRATILARTAKASGRQYFDIE